jgi:hypothetical protein
MNASLSKALAPYVGKLSKEQRTDLTQGVYDEVAKLVAADKTYQDQKKALFGSKKRDAGKIAQLMGNKFDAVVNQATKNVVGRRYGKTAPAAASKSVAPVTPKTGTGSLQSPINVSETPNREDVDWGKTSREMTARGIRVLKTGKVIRIV